MGGTTIHTYVEKEDIPTYVIEKTRRPILLLYLFRWG